MEQVAAKFDRVFSIQRLDGGIKHSIFGFESQGKRYFEVTAPGWPTLEDGMVVTAFVREPGNWNTLFGWVTHETGEIVMPHAKQTLKSGLLWVGLAGAAILWAAVFFPHKAWVSLANYAAAAVCLGLGIVQIRQSLREKRDLALLTSRITALSAAIKNGEQYANK